MPAHTSRRRSRSRPPASKIDIAIFVTGLAAAAGSSVIAYRIVGPYGDGPLNVGLYRAQDPETGEQLVYREFKMADGTVLRYLFSDGSRQLREVLVMRMVNGKLETVGAHVKNGALSRIDAGGVTIEKDKKSNLSKVGFSLRGDGVTDAWEYRDADNRLVKIEVSRQQNGKVDRWEYYENDQLARAEQDDNLDGKVDHWFTYEAGILVKEQRDRDGDGRPDPG